MRVVQADVMQPQTLEAVVEDQDAVITSVSVGNALKEGRKPTTLFSEGTRNVIAAMERPGYTRWRSITRFVPVSMRTTRFMPAGRCELGMSVAT